MRYHTTTYPGGSRCHLFQLLHLLVLMGLVSLVDAFSANLNRPWDTPIKYKSITFIRLSISELDTSKSDESESADDDAATPHDDTEHRSLQQHGSNHTIQNHHHDRESNKDVFRLEYSSSSSSSSSTPQVPASAMANGNASARAVLTVTPSVPLSSSSSPHSNDSHKILSHHQQQQQQQPVNGATALVPTTPTVKSCLPSLIQMTRPWNLPGVVLFHWIGVYLAVQSTPHAGLLWKILRQPTMMITLLALCLTSSTSMLVNDYYDFKHGLDSSKLYSPLTSKKVPPIIVKRFLSGLYATALLSLTMVPGIPARIAVVTGLMLTFWYTEHLKPRTWLKNIVCASLIALSPLASGAAALSMMDMPLMSSATGLTPLLRLVAMLFVGIMGREVMMDINDLEDDSLHGVRTVPVKYGRKFASMVAMACSCGVTGLAMGVPIVQYLGKMTTTTITMTAQQPSTIHLLRRISLATIGSLFQLRRSYHVLATEGQDRMVLDKAIQEGRTTVILLLASFI